MEKRILSGIDTAYSWVNRILERRWVLAIVLILLFAITVAPRLYRIDNPIADWHSWRQADTAAVTRNFIKEGYTPFFPKFDSLISLNEGNLPNPERYFFAEFPLYNSIVYPFYLWFGVDEVYARLVSVFFAALTTVVLYLLVRRFSSPFVALTAAAVFAILPFNIYYGRVVMPDPMHVFFGVLSLYLVALWAQKKTWIWPVLAGVSLAACILSKPYGLVLGLPILYLLWRGYGMKLIKQPSVYVFASIALLPFLAWRWHIHQYPEGMFGTAWLFNQGDIRFTGAYFRWMIYDRMNRLIFATGGFVLFVLGLITAPTKKEGYFYHIWLASVLIFFVVIAKGNVTHDYYQLPLVPVGAIFIAKAVEYLVTQGKQLGQRLLQIGVAGSLFILMVAFGWYEVRGFFNVNRVEMVEAGQYIDANLPADAQIIAPLMSDPAFLYQTNRYGWTIGGGRIEEFRKAGATHLAVYHFDQDEQYWIDRCTVIAEEPDRWAVVDLQDCPGISVEDATEEPVDEQTDISPE